MPHPFMGKMRWCGIQLLRNATSNHKLLSYANNDNIAVRVVFLSTSPGSNCDRYTRATSRVLDTQLCTGHECTFILHKMALGHKTTYVRM